MGSLISVAVADLIMDDVEPRALAHLFYFPPHFWKRYIADMCCTLRTDLVYKGLPPLPPLHRVQYSIHPRDRI